MPLRHRSLRIINNIKILINFSPGLKPTPTKEGNAAQLKQKKTTEANKTKNKDKKNKKEKKEKVKKEKTKKK